MNPTLYQAIKEIQFRLEIELNLLNYGGCGYFAIIMHHILLTKYNIKSQIIFCGNRTLKKYKEIFKEIKQNNFNNSNLLSASHVLLKIDNYYFDGHSFQEENEFQKIGIMTKKELILSLKFGSWNDMYKTFHKKGNKKINFIIKDVFSVTNSISLS